MDNDCHRVSAEFPVICAAWDQAFPAPEALWVDTEHKLLPGGDFLIMARAPGESGGNVHGASGAAGGPDLSEERVHFFQIWGHVRNLTASQPITNKFETGRLDELKLDHFGHSMMAGFLQPIRALMAAMPGSESPAA